MESIRDGLHSKINHPEVSTIYPPFSELVFLIVYLIFPGPITFKVLFTLFDLGTAFLLFRLLKRRDVPTEALIVYLWSPLVVVEVAGSAHVDAMAIFWMVGAMLWVEMDKPIRASAALALSILSKPFALALIPVFWCLRRLSPCPDLDPLQERPYPSPCLDRGLRAPVPGCSFVQPGDIIR